MGKQHGSLARAGKVRKQTPKVEKMEKRKKPKGRSYKRIIYNRRFVNVAPAMKKKSYNWHAGRKDLMEAAVLEKGRGGPQKK